MKAFNFGRIVKDKGDSRIHNLWFIGQQFIPGVNRSLTYSFLDNGKGIIVVKKIPNKITYVLVAFRLRRADTSYS